MKTTVPDNLLEKPQINRVFTFILLGCVWAVMEFLVNPTGNFPLHDDWAFVIPVHSYFTNGSLQFSGWQDMTLIAQVLWGIVFCLPFGVSYNALRLPTMCLGFAGIIFTYMLLEEITEDRRFALIGALLVMVNPVYFTLSNTFMTDVPFYAFSILSVYLYLRGIRADKGRDIALATIVAGVAMFIRQPAIVIPFAFAAAYLIKNGLTKKNIFVIIMPGLALVAAAVAYKLWVHEIFNTPDFCSNKVMQAASFFSRPPKEMLIMINIIWVKLLLRLGLYLFPCLFLYLVSRWGQLAIWMKWSFVMLFICGGLGLCDATYVDMMFYYSGWNSAPNGDFLYRLYNIPKPMALLLAATASFGAAVLLLNVILWIKTSYGRFRDLRKVWPQAFILSNAILYIIPLVGIVFYERYIFVLLPMTLLLLEGIKELKTFLVQRHNARIAIALLIIYGAATVCVSYDFFSFNRARWKALNYLMEEKKISPVNIDGGLEFNGMYNYDPSLNPSELWDEPKTEYAVSFMPCRGYDEIKTFAFKRRIPIGEGRVLVLHKSNPS